MKDRRRTSSLRVQIFLRTLVVGLVPLALLAFVAVLGIRTLEQTAEEGVAASRDQLASETVAARLQSESEATAREIDLILAERINDVVTWSRQPTVIEGSEAAAQLAAGNGLVGLDAEAAEARFSTSPSLGAAPLADAFLAAEMERRGEFVDISYTDRNGFNAGFVGTQEDFVQSDEAWWQSAWDNGIYVGGIAFHPESGGYVIPISSRIENAQGTRVGVLRASLSIAFVQSVADAHTGDDVDLVVVTAAKQLLAETATGHSVDRIGTTELTDADFDPGVLSALTSSDGALISEEAVYGYTRVESSRGAVERAEQVDRFDWFIVSSQPTSIAFAPLDRLEELNQDLGRASQQLSLVTLFVLLLACVVSAAAAVVMSRKVVGPIKLLTERARRAAEEDLPLAVARVQDDTDEYGPIDDPDIEAHAGNELQELATSFNSVQRTAIRLASEQVRQRQTIAEMFANLGRRNQSLVKRQLRFIEELELSEEDPERLSSLFRLDHLATRMRRNAESLLVIAGHRSATRRSTPVRLELVTQAALGEVEDFQRVDATSVEPAALLGRTVADVAHILAELIENALSFSPPEAPVVVHGSTGATHYTMAVVDRGIGLSSDELAAINERLVAGSGLDLTSSKQLGLLVVSKLAARHDLAVRLVHTETGGISAQVDIPNSLIQGPEAAPALPSTSRGQHQPAQPTQAPTPAAPIVEQEPSKTEVGEPAAVASHAAAGNSLDQHPAAAFGAMSNGGSSSETPSAAARQTGPSADSGEPGDGARTVAADEGREPVGGSSDVVSTSVPVEVAPEEPAEEPTVAEFAPITDAPSSAFPEADAADGAETTFEAGAPFDPITTFDPATPFDSADSMAAANRRKDDLPPSVADSLFRAPGLPVTDADPRAQVSDDPDKQRRSSDAGFGVADEEQVWEPTAAEVDAPGAQDAEPVAADAFATDIGPTVFEPVVPTVAEPTGFGATERDPGEYEEAVFAAEFDDADHANDIADPGDLAHTGDTAAPDDTDDAGDLGDRSSDRYIGSLSSKSAAQISSVTRRASRRPSSEAKAGKGAQRTKRAIAITDSADEVSQEAEKLRSRWSSFQDGRRQAKPTEPESTDEQGR